MLFFVVSLAVLVYATSASDYPTINKQILKKIFDNVKPYSDLSSAFYSIKGLELVGEKVPENSLNDICTFVKSKVDKNNLESIYYGTSIAALVPNCVLPTADYQTTIKNGATSKSVADLYFYTLITLNVKLPIDAKAIKQSVIDGLKADSSIVNQAYSLHIATLLTPEYQKTFYDTIEDILDQADEVDKKFLQYEGGVGTTSLVLEGIFALSEKQKELPKKFDQARLSKFVNYLTSKRYPTNAKSAYHLLRASLKLADNPLSVPLVLNRLSPVSVSPAQPNLLVSVTNVLGMPVKNQLVVTAESSKSQKANGPALFAAKQTFSTKSSDGTTFELKLIDKEPKPADFYTIAVNVAPKAAEDKRFFLAEKTVSVKITTQADVADIQVGVADRDQSTPKLVKVEANSQHKLDADQQSKFYLKFAIKEKSKGGLIEAHQAFVRFTESKSGREIVFLAQSTKGQYSAEVDFTTNAKNFRHYSGVYSVELIVSDSLIENPSALKLAELKLKFSDEASVTASDAAAEKAKLYSKLPEIKHMFRQPEKLPSSVVSTVFSVLCLLPVLVLGFLWLAIGFNFSKFQFSLWGIVFHVTLAAIFGLFYCYWVQLTMFVTLRYLTILGVIAYVSGNKLLRSLAATKEKKN